MTRPIFAVRSRICALRAALLFVALTGGVAEPRAQPADPRIQSIVNAVSLDSLLSTVGELSGNVPTIIEGVTRTITTRNVGKADHALVAPYLKQRFERFGLAPVVQVVDSVCSNVYVVQQGVGFPNRKWIICAHFDDAPSGARAPGADDNASGAAVILEAARILSHFVTRNTIVYALFDSEEKNTVGSVYYATQAHARHDSIAGVINVDMIAYDGDNDGRMEIHARPQSARLADTLVAVNAVYQLGLQPVIENPGLTNSDHGSFWEWGYNAVWLIESYEGGDFNPGYHTTGDTVGSFTKAYYAKIAGLAIAGLGIMADVTGPASGVEAATDHPASFVLHQNYPNPFNPSTTVEFSIKNSEFLVLKVFDLLGREVAVLVNGPQSPGRHSVTFDASKLASGVYLCRMQAGPFVSVRKMLLVR